MNESTHNTIIYSLVICAIVFIIGFCMDTVSKREIKLQQHEYRMKQLDLPEGTFHEQLQEALNEKNQ